AATAVAELLHVESGEKFISPLANGSRIESVKLAEVFYGFVRGEAIVESGGGGKEADIGADFLRLARDIIASDGRGAARRRKNCGQHAQCGCFPSAVCAQQAVNFAGQAREANAVHGANGAALFVMEGFA